MNEGETKKPFAAVLSELSEHRETALAMGGEEKLAKRRNEGNLNARERLDVLLDEGSFNEFGLLSKSYRPEVRHKSAADGKIAGFGTIDGRPVAVVSNDFTVLGASSSVINGKKMKHIKEIAAKSGMPVIFLGESTGARMPDRMGAPGRAILGQDATEYLRTRRSPWISALLGDCYGSSTWYTCLSDFVVMRKGATMAVASSRVTSLAINQPIDAEELGGWRLHTGTTGLVDHAFDTDEEALEEIKVLLSYLPCHNEEAPPTYPVPADHVELGHELVDVLPDSRGRVYDAHEVISRVVDKDSLYEMKKRFGKSIITGLARINGETVGIISNNPKAQGGAITVDAIRKATSFLVFCDSFNIPLVFMVDQPGFLIGIEGEKRWAPGRIMNWMNALSLCTVPKIAITMRKNYGQAYLNMGGGRMSDVQACWPMADFGFMDPKLGVNVLHQLKEEDDPERFAELVEEIRQDSSAWALAGLYEAQSVLDPAETRSFLINTLGILGVQGQNRVGEHRLSNWPTSY
jgi:acetyl-CoA carboxylase carboxyltransferase component